MTSSTCPTSSATRDQQHVTSSTCLLEEGQQHVHGRHVVVAEGQLLDLQDQGIGDRGRMQDQRIEPIRQGDMMLSSAREASGPGEQGTGDRGQGTNGSGYEGDREPGGGYGTAGDMGERDMEEDRGRGVGTTGPGARSSRQQAAGSRQQAGHISYAAVAAGSRRDT